MERLIDTIGGEILCVERYDYNSCQIFTDIYNNDTNEYLGELFDEVDSLTFDDSLDEFLMEKGY